MSLNILVFKNNAGNPSVTRAQVETDISDANERFAQSTIRLVANINMGGAGDPGIEQPAVFSNGFTDPEPLALLFPNEDAQAALEEMDNDNNTVDVLYVETVDILGVGARAVSYTHSFNGTGNQKYSNWIVMSSVNAGGGKPHTLPHELMHILLDNSHRTSPGPNDPPTALFRGGTTLNKSVGGTKRIGPYPDTAVQGAAGNNDTIMIRHRAETLPQ